MKNKWIVLNWLARIIGAPGLLCYIIYFIHTWDQNGIKNLQNSYLMIGFAALGYLFAWFRGKEGGWVLIFSGVLLALSEYYSGTSDLNIFTGVCSLAIAISGGLFVAATLKAG
jgi:hypothetical protein